MTDLDLIAETLKKMCKPPHPCPWEGDECPITHHVCTRVSRADWKNYIIESVKKESLSTNEIIQRLDRIETLIRTQIEEADDPKSFSSFLNKELRKIGSGARS